MSRAPSVDPAWAWAPYAPSAERPWSLALAGHLFRRAGFGATWTELERSLEEGPARTLERLLRPEADVEAFHRAEDALADGAARARSPQGVSAWWLRRMLETPHPLLEKMTLFWRGHFGATNARVKDAGLIERHVRLLRRHALGRFDALLEEVSHDPATLLTLDAAANRRARPPETYARRLLESFTVGPGNFSEDDARGIARAFAGWFVLSGELRRVSLEEDAGPKRIFGREGTFDSREAVRIAARQPAAARHVVKKLYRFFVSEEEDPSEELFAPLAERFAADRDIGALVETILRSNLFFSPAAYRKRVKSPVEFALGIARGLEGLPATLPLADALARMGQDLSEPPTSEGWPGGRNWIDRWALLEREKLARALVSGAGYGKALDPLQTARRHGHETPERALPFLADLFFQGDLDPRSRSELAEGPAARIFSLPEFHLA